MGYPRATLAVGLLLLFRAALIVVRGRRALTGAGEVPEGFVVPWTAVLEVLFGSFLCLLGLTKHAGGLRPIRQMAGKPMLWDKLHERPGFRCMYTRIRYISPIIAKHNSQQEFDATEKKKQ